jgi:hypothetical protein
MQPPPPSRVPSIRIDGQDTPAGFAAFLLAISRPLRAAFGGRDRYWAACLLSFIPCRLAWLFHIFGSDKQQAGEHAYGATYHEVLHRFRYRRIKLLEIGVLGGASLLAWRAFFPRGKIIGCDIEPKEQFAVGRILTRVADQSSRSDLQRLCAHDGPFDIIIDDGSHHNAHQIFTFYEMFDKLTDDGIYIIEDIQTSFWPGFFGGTNITDSAFQHTCVGEFLELSKYINHNEFFSQEGLDERRLTYAKTIKRIAFEHNVIIIQKGPNDEGSNYQSQAKANANWGQGDGEPLIVA